MTEEEAALLAELRAISNKSASASRFETDDDDYGNANANNTTNESSPRPSLESKPSPKTPAVATPNKKDRRIDSEKKESRISSGEKALNDSKDMREDLDDMALDSDGENSASSKKSLSNNSDSSSSETGTNSISLTSYRKSHAQVSSPTMNTTRTFTPKKSNGTPPWRKKKVTPSKGDVVESMMDSHAASIKSTDVSDSRKASPANGTPSKRSPSQQYGASSTKNEEALLDESNTIKSIENPVDYSGNNDKTIDEPVATSNKDSPKDHAPSSPVKEMSLSSYRQLKKSPTSSDRKQEEEKPTSPPAQSDFGISDSNNKSTFNGERGGAAEDAALLAELRAISMNSRDRFAEDDNNNEDVPPSEPIPSPPKAKKKLSRRKSPMKKDNDMDEKPWKKSHPRDEVKADVRPTVESDTAESAPPPSFSEMGIKSTKESSTFVGERGGAAEDEALLAELRSISMRSVGDRFADDNGEAAPPKMESAAKDIPTKKPSTRQQSKSPSQSKRGEDSIPPWKKPSNSTPSTRITSNKSLISQKPSVQSVTSTSTASSTTIELPSQPATQSSVVVDEDIVVNEDNIIEYLGSQNWKLRKASYDVLIHLMVEKTRGIKAENKVAGGFIHESLDSALPAMLKDNNASALDSALRLTFYYADYCIGGSQPSHVAPIVSSIVSGPALSASRPSTSKLTDCILMKLMEVGRDGPSSVHIVVEMLLDHGLSSKKPKTAAKAVSLILEASRSFGAINLPLSHVTKNATTMLNHANGKVRDDGLQILVEICRAVGSKSPLDNIIAEMRTAQVTELDSYLSNNFHAVPPTIGLRYAGGSEQTEKDALELLKAGMEEDAVARLAARDPVDVLSALEETEYKLKMKEVKWSEKVGALDLLLGCGGERPYKLVQPSSSVNYGPLISELKKLLTHSHFAVKSKALASLGMLAEGVGEKLLPNLKPLISNALNLSKDKKVTKPVEDFLDAMFGNVISFPHLLGKDDGIHIYLDEKKEKNILVRLAALAYLSRCVEKSVSCGQKANLDTNVAHNLAQLAIQSIGDSDSNVRKEATTLLSKLMSHPLDDINDIAKDSVNGLERSNPRMFKLLMMQSTGVTTTAPASSSLPKILSDSSRSQSRGTQRNEQPAVNTDKKNRAKGFSSSGIRRSNLPEGFSSRSTAPSNASTKSLSRSSLPSGPITNSGKMIEVKMNEQNIPNTSDAIEYLSSLSIPNWDVDEEDDGVLAGILSANWKYRKSALEALTTFSRSERATNEGAKFALNVVALVYENTKQLQDSNFNVLKAALDLLICICDIYEAKNCPVDIWISQISTVAAVHKISDKKFASSAPILLTRLCEVRSPENIFSFLVAAIDEIKSPLPHAALLNWAEEFCKDFGVTAVSNSLGSVVDWALKECESVNQKVKSAAISLLKEMYCQLGPVFKAMTLSIKSESVRSAVDAIIDTTTYNQSSANQKREKKFLFVNMSNEVNGSSDQVEPGFELPKTDLMTVLSPNILTELDSSGSKDAWKKRKAALDEVEVTCSKYNGLISSSPDALPGLVELVRALKSRMKDSQANLKPIAARDISLILNSVDSVSQVKLGRIAYGPLIYASLTDNKKIVRDASLEALLKGTMASDLNGSAVNGDVAETLMSAFSSEVEDTDFKAVGLPEVLHVISERVSAFRPYSQVSSSKAKTIYAQFAKALVGCLMAPKSESRAAAENVLNICVKHRILTVSMIEKPISRLTQGEQKSLQSVVEGLKNISIDQDSESAVLRDTVQSRRGEADEKFHPKVRSRSSSRPSRKSIVGEIRPVKEDLVNETHDPNAHPLKGASISSEPIKRQRCSHSTKQKDSIPEYPFEPSVDDSFEYLKKAWFPFLPSLSIEKLFPLKGFKTQDDAASGVDLLLRAINNCVDNKEETILIDQLDLIIRWFVIALCCRESTSGMESLMTFLEQLISTLQSQRYELSDFEASLLLPYVIDKAATARGRFKEKVRNILDSISDSIYPPTKYGPLICVMVMESGKLPKSRVFAALQLQNCIEKVGISAIGKKGIQVTAKAFSEETLSEQKSVYLDLIETIIVTLNGDVSKFFKLCGSTLSFSRQSRQLIEDRMAKSSKRPSLHRQSTGKITNQSSSALNLNETKDFNNKDADDMDGPFKFSYGSNQAISERPIASAPSSTTFSQTLQNKRTESFGTAAALRERLQQIRTKHQNETEDTITNSAFQPEKDISESSCALYDDITNKVTVLLALPTPLSEIDGKFTGALVGLRQLHSSLSSTNVDNTGTSADILKELRDHVQQNVPECIEMLTKVLDFGFKCGTPTHRDGLSVPLLSVSIAGLMAIFLDPSLAAQVNLSSLSVVIFQATASLLDRRLSSSSSAETSGLDTSTCKKMVKAINKLAIQAAYGCMRHISLTALISLQIRLCSSIDHDNSTQEQITNTQRMSRIVTKLFSRVIKAEESEIAPFTSRQTNVEAILMGVEKNLIQCNSIPDSVVHSTDGISTLTDPESLRDAADKLAPCHDMIHTLVLQLIKAKNSQDSMQELKSELETNGLHYSTFTGRLVASCCTELGLTPIYDVDAIPSNTKSKSYDPDYLSELIYAVGRAADDDDRVASMDDLRDYLDAHQEIDIKSHLSSVSAPFRKYILDQLRSPVRNIASAGTRSMQSNGSLLSRSSGSDFNESNSQMSMSEKLRYLKSKINAAEATAQSAMGSSSVASASNMSYTSSTNYSIPVSSSSQGVSSLRQRLAAATERANAKSPLKSREFNGIGRPSSVSANTASLRARLESVRRSEL